MENVKRELVSGMFFVLLLTSMLTAGFNTQPVKASGTIYIRADGSVDPSTAPIHRDGNIYTFTDHIYDSIVIQRDNIILDGNDYSLMPQLGLFGIDVSYRNNVTIKKVRIAEVHEGFTLNHSTNCVLMENYVLSFSISIRIIDSHSNKISNNNLTSWEICIALFNSSNNVIYHNNIGPAPVPILSEYSENTWDDGYPSGGNYWSNYDGTDLYSGAYQNESGRDGIGDAAYTIDVNNTDRYPLMAPFNTFYAGTWNEVIYYVDVISNSSVTDFHFNPDEGPLLRFNVTGEDATAGFCRVTIPKDLLWVDDGWIITVDDQLITDYKTIPDEHHTYIYFNYNHTTKTVTIQGTNVIPEFPSTTILLMLMLTTLIATVLLKKKRKPKL